MRGDDCQPDALFSYVSPEQRVPLDHPLRAIRRVVGRAAGLLSDEHFTVDGTLIEAWASRK